MKPLTVVGNLTYIFVDVIAQSKWKIFAITTINIDKFKKEEYGWNHTQYLSSFSAKWLGDWSAVFQEISIMNTFSWWINSFRPQITFLSKTKSKAVFSRKFLQWPESFYGNGTFLLSNKSIENYFCYKKKKYNLLHLPYLGESHEPLQWLNLIGSNHKMLYNSIVRQNTTFKCVLLLVQALRIAIKLIASCKESEKLKKILRWHHFNHNSMFVKVQRNAPNNYLWNNRKPAHLIRSINLHVQSIVLWLLENCVIIRFHTIVLNRVISKAIVVTQLQ